MGITAGMEKQAQEPGTLSQDKARGEETLQHEELDVLELLGQQRFHLLLLLLLPSGSTTFLSNSWAIV